MAITTHHLGWDRPVLPAAAAWLAHHLGDALPGALLVLPAARAGRRLTELLAQRFDGAAWSPPAVTTLSGLPARLVDAEPELHLTLDPLTALWLRATCLKNADRAVLEAVVPRPPGPDDWRGWLALARQLGRLNDELAAGLISAQEVPAIAAAGGVDLGLTESRWAAIAAVQQDYDTARGTYRDEASALRHAADTAPLGPAATQPVVLVGVVEALAKMVNPPETNAVCVPCARITAKASCAP